MYLPGDGARDGLALLECAHRGDWEGARAIFRNCDHQMVAGFLARVCADLLEELTASPEHAVALIRERVDDEYRFE